MGTWRMVFDVLFYLIFLSFYGTIEVRKRGKCVEAKLCRDVNFLLKCILNYFQISCH